LNKLIPQLDPFDVDRIIEMAWEDRTPFEAIFVLIPTTCEDTLFGTCSRRSSGRNQ